MKLYGSAVAPNPRRVRIFLAEKGIEVPAVDIDIVKSENRQPDFLAKNPLGGVPILELDDGEIIAESTAICRYFEETKSEPPLMGIDARDRAVVEMWLRRVEFEVTFPVFQTFRNTHDFFKGRIPQVPEWGAACKKHAIRQLGWLDGELTDRPFVAGDRYTIADIALLVGIDFGRVSEIRIDPEHKNLTRWYGEVSSRPSAKA